MDQAPVPTMQTLDDFSVGEIITFVGLNMLRQNKKSLSPVKPLCRYRGENNTKCAIGFLIPDDVYAEIREAELGRLMIHCRTSEKYYSLLRELRNIHDFAKVESWRRNLYLLARDWECDIEVDIAFANAGFR